MSRLRKSAIVAGLSHRFYETMYYAVVAAEAALAVAALFGFHNIF